MSRLIAEFGDGIEQGRRYRCWRHTGAYVLSRDEGDDQGDRALDPIKSSVPLIGRQRPVHADWLSEILIGQQLHETFRGRERTQLFRHICLLPELRDLAQHGQVLI